MSTCVVSGTFLDPSETAISGAKVKFNIDNPVLNAGLANLIGPKEISTTTATDGTWSLTITQGCSGTLSIDCPPDGLNSTRRYSFALNIPLASTATFSSTWADNQVLPSFTPPFSFPLISGTLATAQLPALTSAHLWVGNSSNLATDVAITGDISISNTGVVTVNTVGTSTAANIHSAEVLANAATDANTASAIVKRDASGNFSAGVITGTFTGTITGNATNVTGIVAIANGGTGQATKGPAFAALSPLSTLGDIIYEDATPTPVRLAGNTTSTKKFLTQTGNGSISAVPGWNTIIAGDVPTLNQNTTGTASNVTGTVAIANGGTGQTTANAGFNALSPMTTGGDLIYGGASGVGTRLANGTVNQYLASAGSTSAPVWTSFVTPTIQTFASGSAQTYTLPSSPRKPIYIAVRMVGGGGGGGGSGTGSPGAGGNGGNSSFGTSLLVANGGNGGQNQGAGGGGTGGSASLGSGPIGTALTGGSGTGGGGSVTSSSAGGAGAPTPFAGGGGGGGQAGNDAGYAAATNSGSGGGGAGSNSTGINAGGGGGAGGYVDAIIASPSNTYTYTVGAAGTAGTAGTNGSAGGAGAAGYIEVIEYYQ